MSRYQEAQRAMAAAEVVAALRESPGHDLLDEVVQWVERHHARPDDELVRLAVQAVGRIRMDSELDDLWEEDNPELWRRKVACLQ